jgi:hypothetical protein
MTIKFLIPYLTALCSFTAAAQHIWYPQVYPINLSSKQNVQLTAGDATLLSGVNQVNIVYDYTQMHIDKYLGEEEYLREEMNRYGEDTARARKFKQRWIQHHYMIFEPAFEASFNEAGKKAGISGSNYSSNNAITLEVLITKLDYGFYAVYVNKPAIVSAECVFVDQEGNILAQYSIQNAPGKATAIDIDNVTKCYRKAAKMLAKKLAKDQKEKK